MQGHNTGRLLVRGGCLITGDGMTSHAVGSVRIRNGVIVEVTQGSGLNAEDETVLSAEGMLVLPGFINGHAHATTLGPSMPSGSPPLSRAFVEWQRNRHLLSGTTSLLNVCGLAMSDERDGPLATSGPDIHLTTAHTPASIAAADLIDGKGLSSRHRSARIEDLVDAGCRVLGEAGGGQTLGGGAQDYRFIPEAISAITGVLIPASVARQLKEAILGRHLDGSGAMTDQALQDLLSQAGLSPALDPDNIRVVFATKVMAPVRLALVGLEEVAQAAASTGLPAIFHHAAPTAAWLATLARRYPSARMIAAHANHPSFTPEEAVAAAGMLKALGVTIDLSTLDVIETRFRNSPDNFDALVDHGLVDTISTDFAGGDWDTIPSALHRMQRKSGKSLAEVVALATGNVARALPEIFGDRGLIKPGKRADLVITEKTNLAKVRDVILHGRHVVENGRLQGPDKG